MKMKILLRACPKFFVCVFFISFVQTVYAQLNTPFGIAVFKNGSQNKLYLTDSANHRVLEIDLTKPPASLAAVVIGGDGSPGNADGPAAIARFNHPMAIAVNSAGTILYVADSENNKIRKIEKVRNGSAEQWVTSTIQEAIVSPAGSSPVEENRLNQPTGITFGRTEDILYVTSRGNNKIFKISALNTPHPIMSLLAGTGEEGFAEGAALTARFSSPMGVTFHNDVLYVADFANNQIRRITINADGSAHTVSSIKVVPPPGGQPAKDNLYNPTGLLVKLSADRSQPIEIYVADTGHQNLRRIYKTSVQASSIDWTIETLAGEHHLRPDWVSLDHSPEISSSLTPISARDARFISAVSMALNDNNLYIVDSGSSQIKILQNSTAGAFVRLFRFNIPPITATYISPATDAISYRLACAIITSGPEGFEYKRVDLPTTLAGAYADPRWLLGSFHNAGWMNFFRLSPGIPRQLLVNTCDSAVHTGTREKGSFTRSIPLALSYSTLTQYPIMGNDKRFFYYKIPEQYGSREAVQTKKETFLNRDILTFYAQAARFSYEIKDTKHVTNIADAQTVLAGTDVKFRLLNEARARVIDLMQNAGDADVFAVALKFDGSTTPRRLPFIVIAFKGTSSLADVRTDVSLGVPWLSERVRNYQKEAYNFYSRVKDANAGVKIILTGHSLGALMATLLAFQTGDDARVFSSPANYVGLDRIAGMLSFAPLPNVVNFYIEGDPVVAYTGRHASSMVIFPPVPGSSILDSHKMGSLIQQFENPEVQPKYAYINPDLELIPAEYKDPIAFQLNHQGMLAGTAFEPSAPASSPTSIRGSSPDRSSLPSSPTSPVGPVTPTSRK